LQKKVKRRNGGRNKVVPERKCAVFREVDQKRRFKGGNRQQISKKDGRSKENSRKKGGSIVIVFGGKKKNRSSAGKTADSAGGDEETKGVYIHHTGRGENMKTQKAINQEGSAVYGDHKGGVWGV